MKTATQDSLDHYIKRFQEFEKEAGGPEWLAAIRHDAMEAFLELGFPTTRNEEWKYTSVATISSDEFARLGATERRTSELERIRGRIESLFADFDCPRIVFINGHFSGEFSSLASSGARVMPLAEALASHPSKVEPHLAAHADWKSKPFVALNTAFTEDGAFVEIPKGTVAEKPILIVHFAATEGRPMVTHPRNLIVAERESQATVIEFYLGPEGSKYLTNPVTEAAVGESSILNHVKVQWEGDGAAHVASLHFQQARDAVVHATTVTFGAALDREEPVAVLDGDGGEVTLNGLYVLAGEQHADHHTTLDHAKPHCGSRELYKGILEGKATGVFNGKIIVRPDAQKTDSKQSNKNLLLSSGATINTKPQLEIWADDVKCTHGATVGQIDAESLFYLRSRGIGLAEARSLLVVAFANDVLDKIPFAPLREKLKTAIATQLSEPRRS